MSTKKMKILIALLVVALIFGTGAYIAVDTLKSREEQAQQEELNSMQLFNFDEDSINKVEITLPEGNFTIEPSTDTGWAITDTNYNYPIELNAYYINTICNYMSNLTALKKLNVSAEQLSSYGLDQPQPLTCYNGDTAYTLYLGNASATEEYFYVMLPDDPVVYAVDFQKGEIMKGGLSYLKDPYLITWLDVDINYVKLQHKQDISFEIQKNEDNLWEMSAPLKDASLNAANINSMLTSITRLQVDNFVQMVESPKDLAKYHLDDPAYQFTLKNTDGETLTLDFANFKSNDTEVYFVYEESGQIAAISPNGANFLKTEASELMTDTLYSPEYTDVASLSVQVDDLQFNLEMNHEQPSYRLIQQDGTETDITSMNDSVQKAFSSLFQSVSKLTYDSLDLNAEPDTETEPTVIFRYTLNDGTETELSLVPIDDTFYQSFLNGEYTGKIVRRRALSGNAGVITCYEKLLDEIALN